MDNLWERSIPFYKIGIKEAADVFSKYDKHLEVLDLTPINVGCRNSNYKVHTSKGLFLLRVCPLNDRCYKKEEIISGLSCEHLKVPELYFISENNITQRVCLIYQYISGSSMQDAAVQRGRLDNSIIVKVAESASYIHSCDIINNEEFGNDYPPFLTWYDFFLDQDVIEGRIGNDVKKRVRKLISDKKDDLNVIDNYISFIHSDFRPANMIVDKDNNVWIVDWEYSGIGHSLADIGQFFRYSCCFETKQYKLFEEVYNSFSKRALPPDWYELSRLRDLVNPLQMLGAKENLPHKYADLKNLIFETLAFFNK